MIILIFHRNAICQKFSNHWLGWLAVGKYNNTARNDLKVRVKQLTQLSLGNCLLLYRYSPQSITREKLVTIIKYYTIRFRLFSSPYLIFPYFLFIFYYFIFSWGGGAICESVYVCLLFTLWLKQFLASFDFLYTIIAVGYSWSGWPELFMYVNFFRMKDLL